MSGSSPAADLWAYLRVRKKYWLLPIILILLLFGLLFVYLEGTVLSAFMYTFF